MECKGKYIYFYFADLPAFIYCINIMGYVQPEVSLITTMELPLAVMEQPSSFGAYVYVQIIGGRWLST